MRGVAERQALMSGLTQERPVPKGCPPRRIKRPVDSGLARMSPLIDELCASGGRPSIPTEHPRKSSLLVAFCTVRSEHQPCEQLGRNLLFKWFLA